MQIGISIITHPNQNIWENGMGQNITFLTQAFLKIDFIKKIIFIDIAKKDNAEQYVTIGKTKIPVFTQQQASDTVDVIIELAGALDPKWLKLQRARGKKVVYYNVGQPYVGLIEHSVFEKPGTFHAADRCDEVWLFQKDAAFIPMLTTMLRTPVKQVPYLWSPYFISARVKEVEEQGYHYGWKGTETQLDVAIFEPNISVVKNCLIPMLAVDRAYRTQPDSINMLHVLNSWHVKDHTTFLHLANSLALVQDHKACFHSRHDIVGFMAQTANAVVSHQWENNQNYLYLDALYGNYPLIHNSPWLHSFNVGYFYHDFNINEASEKITEAWQTHNQNLPDYQNAKNRLYAEIDPTAPKNVQAYAQLLRSLVDNTASQVG